MSLRRGDYTALLTVVEVISSAEEASWSVANTGGGTLSSVVSVVSPCGLGFSSSFSEVETSLVYVVQEGLSLLSPSVRHLLQWCGL